jgi:hypothetical protein
LSTADRHTGKLSKPTFNKRVLHSRIMRMRSLGNATNLAYLASDYLCVLAVMGGAVAFWEYREAWNLNWAWNVPVVATAVVLIGAL